MTSVSLLTGRTVDSSSRLTLSSAEFFFSKYTLGNKTRAQTILDADPVRRFSVQTENAMVISRRQSSPIADKE